MRSLRIAPRRCHGVEKGGAIAAAKRDSGRGAHHAGPPHHARDDRGSHPEAGSVPEVRLRLNLSVSRARVTVFASKGAASPHVDSNAGLSREAVSIAAHPAETSKVRRRMNDPPAFHHPDPPVAVMEGRLVRGRNRSEHSSVRDRSSIATGTQ